MADVLDEAERHEQMARDIALAGHARRTREPLPLCESCGELPVHVTALGVRWRFCADCAEEHVRTSAA